MAKVKPTDDVAMMKDGPFRSSKSGTRSRRREDTQRVAISRRKIGGEIPMIVSEEKKAREEIKEHAESIIETIREPLIVLNNNLKIISANNSFYKVFKVSKKETIGKKIYDLGNRQWNIPKLRTLLENILPKKTTFKDFEVTHKFETIGEKVMLLNAKEIKRKGGKKRLILLAIEDITEKRRLEQAKKQIFLNTSHELKSPITPIQIQAEMLKNEELGKLSPKQKESVNLIIRNIERLDHLISDILEVSRIQAKIIKLKVTQGNLKKIADEAVSKFKPLAEKKGLKLINNVSDTLVSCDVEKIKQVFTNLLDNAIKFTQKGSITINTEKKKDVVIISMKDTGMGIAKEDIAKLFSPFYQVKPSYKIKKVGTGLGLSITRSLVQQHGGKIWVESAGEGEGSTFYFTLPLKVKILKGG